MGNTVGRGDFTSRGGRKPEEGEELHLTKGGRKTGETIPSNIGSKGKRM